MIQSVGLNQVIANKTMVCKPCSFGSNAAYQNQMNRFEKGEKLNINCCGTREYSVNGQNINYLA